MDITAHTNYYAGNGHEVGIRQYGCSVFWIDASDIDHLHQAYPSIAQKLDVPGWDDEKVDIKQLVKHYSSGKLQGSGC